MKKKSTNVLSIVTLLVVFAALGCFLVVHAQEQAVSATTGDTGMTLAELDELMKDKTLDNCNKAIKGYEALLKKGPESCELLYKTSKAYIAIIDIETSALIVEKDEYKPILLKMGNIAYNYAQKAYKLNPKDKEAVTSCIVSYGYYSASFGIFKAIMKGAAGKFKDYCNELIALDPNHMGGLGYRALGKFYFMAPWPAGSTKKALNYFQLALKSDPKPLETRYFLGMIYFDKDKYDQAKNEFTFIVQNTPCDHEKHYIEAYKKEAEKYLKKISEIEKD